VNQLTRLIATVVAAASIGATAQSPPAADDPLGALLYSTHCVACHSAQIHWRDRKLVTSWTSLKAEVRRWQSNAGLGWGEDEVAAVARHLNAVHYHLPAADAGARGRNEAVRAAASGK